MGAPAGNPRRRSCGTQGRESAFMGILLRDGSRTGWRAVLDPVAWVRTLLLTAVFVVSLSALACAVGLARNTRGHDWYASAKLSWAEILLGLNFDPQAPVTYRTGKGEEVTLARGDLIFSGEALVARNHLVRTAKRSAEIGAWCGLGGALMCLVLLGLQRVERGGRPESSMPPRERPGFMVPAQAPAAPARPQADRPPDAQPPLKPGPAGKDRGKAAPARRERGYGRWF